MILGGIIVLCVIIIYVMQHIIDDLVETRTCKRLHVADASDRAFSKPALVPRVGSDATPLRYSRHTWNGGPTDAA